MTQPLSTTDLVIGGMTCASCAARVEKKLNKLDGVTATVNLATETAHVSFPGAVSVADLIAAVGRTGYTAALPAPSGLPEESGLPGQSELPEQSVPPADGAEAPAAAAGAASPADAAAPRRRLVVSLALAVPVVVLAMLPAARFPGWQWVSLALATPVATWGAWPFHRAAAVNARHGAATMDTLVSVGVAAAYLWSVSALAFGGAETYLEVAVGVTALILLGRYLELRARRQAGTALKALLDLGAKQATVLRDGREVTVAGRRARGRRRVRGPAGGEDRDRRCRRRRALRGRHVHADRRAGAGRGRPGRRGDRRVRQRRRPAHRPRYPGRRGHPARPDGPAGHPGAGGQGAGAAARGPRLRRVRSRRARHRRGDAGRLAGRRRVRGGPRSPPRSRC